MSAGGLARRLCERIALEGPMSVPDYMAACLHDPDFGYYATRPALGESGDFVTAPLVSQMFGEMIAAWIAEVWTRIGQPSPFRLVEIGPGDGTLAQDLLRALARAPGLLDAADLWLVETSIPLRRLQAERLNDAAVSFADRLEDVPAGAPVLIVANEVLDCLGARQFVRTADGWAERRIGLGGSGGDLVFGLSPQEGFAGPAGARPGELYEVSPAQAALGAEIGARVAQDGGAALLIDYGRDRLKPGDTLQALRRHRKVDPLSTPGEADLTQHADFPAVAAAARAAGAQVAGPVGQGAFLSRLGVRHRAEALTRARPDRAEMVARQLSRLVDADQMGTLFKVVALHAPGVEPPGFGEETP